MLTPRGHAAVEAGKDTIVGLEHRLIDILGDHGHRTLRRLLLKVLDEA